MPRMATVTGPLLVLPLLASTFCSSHAFWTQEEDDSVTFEHYQMRRSGSQLRTLCSLLSKLVSWVPSGIKLGSLGCETISNPRLCPATSYCTEDRLNPVTTEGVASWEACSLVCHSREDCKHWTWHNEGAGEKAYQCVTMGRARRLQRNHTCVSGDVECRPHGNIQEEDICLGGGIYKYSALHCTRETQCPDTNFAMSQISNDSWNSSEVASWVACSDLCRKRHGTSYWRWSNEGVCLKGWTWTYQEKSRTCYYYQGEQYYQIS